MTTTTHIAIPEFSRLIGLPNSPAVADVRTDEDYYRSAIGTRRAETGPPRDRQVGSGIPRQEGDGGLPSRTEAGHETKGLT
jgi:hypothetical protein